MTNGHPLGEEERALRERLGRAGSPPFLGHFAVSAEAARRLRAELASAEGSCIVALRRLFWKWPALATAWIAGHVRARYGEADDQRFWPLLAELIGRELPPQDRPLLVQWFAYACKHLEVAVASDGSHVDRLVVQAGAPSHQLDVLVRRLLEAERVAGLPEEDDDLACAQFASETADRLRSTNPRLARILEADVTAWYVREWVRLRSDRPGDGDPEFQEALRQAVEQLPERAALAPPPQLVWADGELAIRVPPFRRGRLRLSGKRELVIEPLERAELVSPAELAIGSEGLRWAFEGSGRTREGCIAPPAPDGSELLLFEAASGRLAGRARFATPEGTLALPPGRYVALATGRFTGPEGPAERLGDLWLADLVLDREAQTFGRGALGLRLAPSPRPRIELAEPAFVALDGRAVHAGPDLRLHVRHEREGTESRYELLVEADGRELQRVPVALSDGEGEASLEPALSALPAQLSACRFALVREGERRALARARALVWNGLERVEDGRFFGAVPENLDRSRSREIVIDERGVALRRDRSYEGASLLVRGVGERGGELELRIAPPDPVALLESRDERGRRVAQLVDPQQPIVVPPGDPRMLEIRCPNPAAVLRIGGQRHAGAFRHGPAFRLPLVAAAENCRGLDPTIEVVSPTGASWPVARLTIPNEALAWVGESRAEADPVLAFRLREPVAALHLDGRELLAGRSAVLELAPDGLARREAEAGLVARLEIDPGRPPYAFRLVLDRSTLPRGIWLFGFETRDLGTIWRSPSNARGDRFAWLVEQGLQELAAGDLGAGLGLAGVARLFKETHRALRRCYGRSAWEAAQVNRLEAWWRRSAGALEAAPGGERLIACLLPLAFEDPPSDAAPSWVPILGFWQVFPRFLALPAALYGELDGRSDEAARTLAGIAALAGAGSLARWAASGTGPSVDFLGCFANVAAASAGAGAIELRGFDIGRFAEAVERASDPERASGETGWLAASALLDAAERFARRWSTVSRSGGYANHRPAAMAVVRAAARWLRGPGTTLARQYLADLEGPLAIAVPRSDGAEDALLEELQPGASAVALASRLEPRRPGTLERFLVRLDAEVGDRERTAGALEFLWNLGRDSFAFWALFWEALLVTGDRHA